MLKSMITGARVPAPRGVFEAYAEVMSGYAEPVEEAGNAANSLTARA
jgi:hypothetical protein